jgi:hypothetical protein
MYGPQITILPGQALETQIDAAIAWCKNLYQIEPTQCWLHPENLMLIKNKEQFHLNFRSVNFVAKNIIWVGI